MPGCVIRFGKEFYILLCVIWELFYERHGDWDEEEDGAGEGEGGWGAGKGEGGWVAGEGDWAGGVGD